MVCIVETVRGQREHARKCSGAYCNHQQQAQAKSAYGRGQDKRADAERGTDLPDELLAWWSRYPCGQAPASIPFNAESFEPTPNAG